MGLNDYIKSNYVCTGENPCVISGMGRAGLYKLFAELGYKLGCEVGVQSGRNAKVMFDLIPDLKLYLVDPYKNHDYSSYKWDEAFMRRTRRRTHRRLSGRNTVYMDQFSEDAVREIPYNSLDFVYIDGDHSYDYVMMDVILWGRKIRKGGIISGHDYYYNNDRQSRQAKVTAAINDYTRIHKINPWFITDKNTYKEKGDGYPSWFWVKQEDIYPNRAG